MPDQSFPSFIPYCGAPPVPAELWSGWNGDPRLLAAFALAAVAYPLLARRRGAGLAARPSLCFAAAWLVLFIALVSPLCNLTSALFSARVAQHLLTIQVAAPLFVLAWPIRRPAPAVASPVALPGWVTALAKPLLIPEVAWTLFGVCLWVWHLPGPYMAALQHEAILWTMHGTLFVTAIAAWRTVLAVDEPARRVRGLLSAFGTSIHLTLLAALLIFAPDPLFSYHLTTTAAWGLSPLADQQLGGLIMGVVGSMAYVALTLFAAARWFLSLEPRRAG